MSFIKATKKQAKLRAALVGPSGSGKTYTALLLAKHLGQKIAVIDTERGSASKYADDVASFDAAELRTFEPKNYIAALKEAAAAGYDVVVIDSLSHAWTGEGGIISQRDKMGDQGFSAWRTLTPQHNALVDAVLAYPGHVIVTMRSKTEYIVEQGSDGKSRPRKVGLAPVQRDGMEYEFDVIGEMDQENILHVGKSRCPALTNEHIRKPGEELAKTLLDWLSQGVEAPAPPPPTTEKPLPKASAKAKQLARAILDCQMLSTMPKVHLVDKTEAFACESLVLQRTSEISGGEGVADDRRLAAISWIKKEIEQ